MQASEPLYVIGNQTYTSPNMQNECDNVTLACLFLNLVDSFLLFF